MEIDTGTAVSVISKSDYYANFKSVPLEASSKSLRAYSGDMIQLLGKMNVNVKLNSETANLDLLVVPRDGPAFFLWKRLAWKATTPSTRSQNLTLNYV